MKEVIVKRDEDRDIKFTGEKIASVSSSFNNAHPNYSGTTGRCATLTLWRTKGGQYVCQKIDHTLWQGEREGHSACICQNVDEIIDFYGNGWLAKSLLDAAEIDSSIQVE